MSLKGEKKNKIKIYLKSAHIILLRIYFSKYEYFKERNKSRWVQKFFHQSKRDSFNHAFIFKPLLMFDSI